MNFFFFVVAFFFDRALVQVAGRPMLRRSACVSVSHICPLSHSVQTVGAPRPCAGLRPHPRRFSTSAASSGPKQGAALVAARYYANVEIVPRIKSIAAYIVQAEESGADYHRQREGHWIVDSPISNPMSVYEQYRKSRLRYTTRCP